MHVQVGDLIAEHEGVDVSGTFSLDERPAQARHQYPQRLGLLVREVSEASRVASRLDE